MTESITFWLQLNQHPPFDTILYLNGLLKISDCGRLSFFQLTNIFDTLQHETINDKVRFERDMTALHMQYRKYHSVKSMKSIQRTTKQAGDTSIRSVIPTLSMNQNATNWAQITPIPSINHQRRANTTGKHQIVSIKLNESPKKSTNPNTLRLVGDNSWKWSIKHQKEKKVIQKRYGTTTVRKLTKQQHYVVKNQSKNYLFQRIKTKYIWIYKNLIVSYLDTKRLKMPEKYVYDSLYTNHDDIHYDDNKYKVEINVSMPGPQRITSDGFDNNQVLAEYDAFYNLFVKLVKSREMEEKLMSKLIAQYPFELDHRTANNWWFQGCDAPRRVTLDFFYDIGRYRSYYEQDKAIYCYNINRDFDDEFKDYNLSEREKQMLWYHAVSYLFRIKFWMDYPTKDLLLFLMSTYFSRREFFENVSKYGMDRTMKFMAIRQK